MCSFDYLGRLVSVSRFNNGWVNVVHGGGGGGNFHYKGIHRCAAGMGYTFQASQYMNGYHFYIKSISMGYLFHPKGIWMGKIWKIVYEWGQFSKIVYEWGQFLIWEVYEWVMFFTGPGIWMGWGSGTPDAHPYPKSWQVTPRDVVTPTDCPKSARNDWPLCLVAILCCHFAFLNFLLV